MIAHLPRKKKIKWREKIKRNDGTRTQRNLHRISFVYFQISKFSNSFLQNLFSLFLNKFISGRTYDWCVMSVTLSTPERLKISFRFFSFSLQYFSICFLLFASDVSTQMVLPVSLSKSFIRPTSGSAFSLSSFILIAATSCLRAAILSAS